MLNWRERFRNKFQFNYLHMLAFLLFGHMFGKNRKKSFAAFSQKEIDFYDFKLAPIIEGFEAERKKALNWFRIKFFIWFGVIIVISYYNVLVLALLVAFVTFPAVIWNLKGYKARLKDKLMPEILGYFQGKYRYESRADSMDFERLYSYGIMPQFNKLRAEDYIFGKKGSMSVELTELNLSVVTIERSRKRNMPDHEREVSTFHGLCVVITFNKAFKNRIIAVPRGEYLGNSAALSNVKLQRVKLEDPRFEAIFDLYATDQIEARYIFTPTLMERLVALKSELGGGEIRCSFYNNKLQILIPTDYDHFRIGSIFKEIDFIDEFRMILREMHNISKIVDVLKLNKRY